MKIESLKCNNCSANLNINPNVQFFTCAHCGSSLTIKKSGNVIYTEVLDEIKDNMETLKEHSKELLMEQKIERLDRDWLLNRERYKVQHGKHGFRYPDDPNSGPKGGIIMSLIFLVVVIGMFLTFSKLTNPAGSMKPTLTINGQPVHPSDPLYKNFHPKQKSPMSPVKVMFIVFVLIIVGANIVHVIYYNMKSKRYYDAKTRYLRQRKKLLDELE